MPPCESGDLLERLRASMEDSELTNAEKAQELRALFAQETEQRRLTDETYKQLQIEYQTLLKKYAEAENTIDELRLGAKVKLYGLEGPGPASSGLPTAQQAASLPNGALGSAVVTSVSTVQGKFYMYTCAA